jgi:hypothetical protein
MLHKKRTIIALLSLFFLLLLIEWGTPATQSYLLAANDMVADRDADGVPDAMDACPALPGNLTNATNIDGCPGLEENIPPNMHTPGIFIQGPACNMCPCPTLDYLADIRLGDIIFAIISDLSRMTIYTKSNLYYIAE